MSAPGAVAVLLNPSAGRGRAAAVTAAVPDRLAAAGRPVRVLHATTGAQAEAACRAALAGGAAALVAVGGDGTVHRAVQAVAGTGVAFGVVAAGTGNDVARAAGLPAASTAPAGAAAGAAAVTAAADAVAAALRAGRTVGVDLARARRPDGSVRWFATVLAAGFDAVVNARAERMRVPRGPARYRVAVVLELARLRARRYTLVVDGADRSFTGVLAAVANTDGYGGGLRIAPAADPADGLLDVVVAGPLGRAGLLRLAPRLRHGTHVADPRVTVHRGRTVRLDAAGVTAYADGEPVGALPLDIDCVPGALRLLR